jgi:hypothetical protein
MRRGRGSASGKEQRGSRQPRRGGFGFGGCSLRSLLQLMGQQLTAGRGKTAGCMGWHLLRAAAAMSRGPSEWMLPLRCCDAAHLTAAMVVPFGTARGGPPLRV